MSVDYPDSDGMSPLTVALLNRCDYAVDVLLEHGANVNPKIQWNGMTLLEIAFLMKDHKSVLALLKHGADIKINEIEQSALVQAICLAHDFKTRSEWEKIVELLIEKGSDIHSNNSTSSPFYESIFLAQQGDFFVLELLLRKGADVNMKVGGGIPSLFLALKWGSLNPNWCIPLIELFIENGVDVNQEHQSMGTLLHLAISDSRFDLVKLFIENGADLNKKSKVQGEIQSPLTLALKLHEVEIVQYLVQHGAKA